MLTVFIRAFTWKPARFAIAGAVGFLVDAAVLQCLIWIAHLDLFTGRVFSFLSAVTVTWILNRHATFLAGKRSALALLYEWVRYLVASMSGGFANYGAYAGCIIFFNTIRNHPVLAVGIGSVAGMTVNYFAYMHFVFDGTHRED